MIDRKRKEPMKNFETFLKENYYSNLSKSTIDKKKAQMKKQANMPDDDPEAYKELPGDSKEKQNLKTSKHTKKYHELYGDEVDEASVSSGSFSGFNWIYDKPFKLLTIQNPKSESGFRELEIKKIEDTEAQKLVKKLQSEDHLSWNIIKSILKKEKVNFEIVIESLNEKEQSTNRSPIDSEAIESGLKKKSEKTGVPIGILRAVMRRGMAAWKSGHRPGAGQEQWGYARVNSFITKGKGTWGKADSDLAKEVRDGGHDKDLKESSECEYEALIEKAIYIKLIEFLHEGVKMISNSLNEGSVDKAQYELSRLLKRAEEKGETPLVKEFVPEIMALVQKFADSGQSGGSAPFTAGAITEVVRKLLAQEPLGGVENSDDEWDDISKIEGVDEGTGTFQNSRLSSVFKEGKEGRPYYLDAIVFTPEGKDYGFTSGGVKIAENSKEKIGSSQYIKAFPFEPKTFKITVQEKEYRKLEDGSLIEEEGGGWWESWIKDPKQLEEVWEYYDKKEKK